MTRVRNGGNKISIARKLLVGIKMATAPSSDEAAQVSVPLKQWAAGLVQAFQDFVTLLEVCVLL